MSWARPGARRRPPSRRCPTRRRRHHRPPPAPRPRRCRPLPPDLRPAAGRPVSRGRGRPRLGQRPSPAGPCHGPALSLLQLPDDLSRARRLAPALCRPSGGPARLCAGPEAPAGRAARRRSAPRSISFSPGPRTTAPSPAIRAGAPGLARWRKHDLDGAAAAFESLAQSAQDSGLGQGHRRLLGGPRPSEEPRAGQGQHLAQGGGAISAHLLRPARPRARWAWIPASTGR